MEYIPVYSKKCNKAKKKGGKERKEKKEIKGIKFIMNKVRQFLFAGNMVIYS